jgi:ATP-dependent DNA helicase RecG
MVYQYRLTQAGEPRLVERLDTPLLLAFERTLRFIEARQNAIPLTLPSGQQITIEEFPELAVREAVANAVLHRDYHLASSVVIEHSPEVFGVSSPGPLVSGVTVDNILTHPSKPRNPLLARVVRQLGLAEEVGRGVDRMYREMIRSGREAPKIEDLIDHVRVTLVGGAPNIHIARYVAQLPEEERDDTDTMIVLHRLCRVRTVNAGEMARAMQKPIDEAEAALRRLAGDHVGILEPTRQSHRSAHPTYRLRGDALKALGPAVPYQRRTVDETDRKIIAHVREYRTVTNKTVQNLFDVGIHKASAICRDLVQRKILVKESSHERGPGVQYGPGPKFPPKAGQRRRGASASRPSPRS